MRLFSLEDEVHDQFLLDLLSNKEWSSNDGKITPVNQMRTSHIINCCKMLERGEGECGEHAADFLALLYGELIRRDTNNMEG